MSNYRNITVDGQEYRFKVGKSNIEIRSLQNEKFKLVLSKPGPVQRWGVIYPNWEVEDRSIRIFTDYDKAEDWYKENKHATVSEHKHLVELVSLNPRPVPITPSWIAAAIREHND